ncbi:MAG: hypothetical protein KME49_20210 [Brasilonema octagenarum HA4186-MV1]|nr:MULTISPECIES: hypothetical protein [Brasilonema]MBW4627761.1 hypothetical protein [Brasilonema octagenarum HA4186-MV1]
MIPRTSPGACTIKESFVNFIIFSYSVVVPVEIVENLMHVYFKDALTGC